MNKTIILSVRPEHAYNILTGNKTLELRKSVPKGYKGWMYVYVTKGKMKLRTQYYNGRKTYELVNSYESDNMLLNGTIPFRFWFDEFDVIVRPTFTESYYQNVIKPLLVKACLSYDDLKKYSDDKLLYAWHIKCLEIFDKPMQLREFVKDFPYASRDFVLSEIKNQKLRITKAPQSYMYAWVKEELK